MPAGGQVWETPMKPQFVKDLQPSQAVRTHFIIREKVLREKKDGTFFLTFELADKTGAVPAVLWDRAAEVNSAVKRDDVVSVTGTANVYQDRLQLTLSAVRKLEEDKVDPFDYLPVTPRSVEEMKGRLQAFPAKLSNPHLSRLIALILEDPELSARFFRAPAATRIHQPYLGGLLEHTLNVVRICDRLKDIYPQIDADLLLAGAILHDVGKIDEYEYERTIGITDQGRLLGHLVLGFNLVDQRARQIEGFPEELRLKLGHIILSHHGELEWGSPKVPMLLEAIVLHHADNLDAKVDIFRRAVESVKDPTARWSEYQRELSRFIFLGNRFTSEGEGDSP